VSIATAITSAVLAVIIIVSLWRRFEWPRAVWRWICSNKFELTLLGGIGVMLLGLALALLGILDLKEQSNANEKATAIVGTTLQEYGEALRNANPQLPIPQIVQPTPEEKKTKSQKVEDEKPKIIPRPPLKPPPSTTPAPTPTPVIKKVPGPVRYRIRKEETLLDKLFKKRTDPKRTR
jgi:outer membrane biosynthesis protein TonB